MSLRFNAKSLETWNRKLHYYLGLYLLLFVWVFAFTGLLLNHHWEFSNFWPKRQESVTVRTIESLPAGTNREQARDLMRQLGLAGELQVGKNPARPGRLDFQVVRPGLITQVQSDLVKREATVKRIRVNTWGTINMLHTFSGVRRADPKSKPEWPATKAWAFSMDAVAAGLIVMVLSSYYMWYRLKRSRWLGWLSLAAGFLSCGFFVVGLSWMYATG